MDRKYIDDHHVIARYLADRLTDDERQAFEAYYLEHPEVVKEMEAAARFKAGLLQLQQSGELDRLMNAPARRPRWQLSIAAAAIAALAIGMMFFGLRGPAEPPLLASNAALLRGSDGRTLEIASTHQIMRTRGRSADANIVLPATQSVVALEILPEIDEPDARYDVALLRVAASDKTAIATVHDVALNADGFVPVFVDSERLEPGDYELHLSSDARVGEVSAFLLRVQQ